MALKAEDIENATNLLNTDIIIAYGTLSKATIFC